MTQPAPIHPDYQAVAEPQVALRLNVVSATASGTTALPSDVVVVAVGFSGRAMVTPLPAERALDGSLSFIEEVAAALPRDSASEQLVEDHFSESVGKRASRRLTRRAR